MKQILHTLECVATEKSGRLEYRAQERRRLLWCMILTALFMFVEFFGGLWTNSLALISDSAHMFSDLFALGVSTIAIRLAAREADKIRSFGFYRTEILAALFNGLLLTLIVIWITYDAIHRFLNPSPIATQQMLLIAAVGLIVNVGCALLLKETHQHDLNMKSAFLHMIGDTVSSIGIIAAGVLIIFTGKFWFDPLASILIAVLIFAGSFRLIREAIHILLESTPKHLSEEEILRTIKREIPEIHNIHHVHMWELTSKLCTLTAHVEIEDIKISDSEVLRKKINLLLKEHFHITHTNLQFECKK